MLSVLLSIVTTAVSEPAFIPESAQREIAETERQVDRIESESLARARSRGYSLNAADRLALLGKLLLFDRTLSVNSNEACAFCHMPEAGFSGPISSLNQTTVSYPGSVRTRFGKRKPPTIAYSSYSPFLHYNALQGDWIGGSFWDMRSTGARLTSPVAEQAQDPPVDPVEMGLNDSACLVYRLSAAPYRAYAEQAWGYPAFQIDWPSNTARVCDNPGGARTVALALNTAARYTAGQTFDRVAQAIAAYEGSREVNAFTSKYDYVMAGKAEFSADEAAGYQLFRSKARCNECHRDGGPGEEPLFTDFTASNLGVPSNGSIPFFEESSPDRFGYTANPSGKQYIDPGTGAFLLGWLAPSSMLAATAKEFRGRFKVPTLRNVDKRPRPDFVKAYMHNGYFKSLREVVHFYNTRDTLPRCQSNDSGEKVTCWHAPEYPGTMNRKQVGKLGLSDAQENQLVAFLKTLSDGYPAERR
jgi:cytochrome c peroxidase